MWPDHSEETELDPAGPLGGDELPANVAVRRFHLEVVEGATQGATFASQGDRATVGSHPSNHLVLDDRTVSRFHCEIVLDDAGIRLRDLDSRNGTVLDGVRIESAFVKDGSLLRLGQSAVRFRLGNERNSLALSVRSHFGSMVGRSVPMRAAFAVLEKAAPADSTVLIEGETGTGKEEAAHSLHDASVRRHGPFVVVDCSAITGTILESELFGHERGAFTGAVQRRVGAFEAASGGTVFLDEVGELPTDLQPKLLRVLESRTIRRVGGNEQVPVDVRVVAATNRNLKSEVNEGRFRSDLYYRLAVVTVPLPPLRKRPDDIPLLVERIAEGLGADAAATARLLSDEVMPQLQRGAWPGNVRQLRNYIEQFIVLDAVPPAPSPAEGEPAAAMTVDPRLSYNEARRRAIDAFERTYLEAMLEAHGGNVSQAARAAGVSRVYLHRLLRRHELRG